VTVLAERLLAPIVEAKIDTLLLGCTHYPFLARVLSSVLGPEVVLVSSAEETAFDVRARLVGSALARRAVPAQPPQRRFESSGDIEWFKDLGQRLLGPELASAEGVTWRD
jgi:glutamate racemase